MNVRLLDQVPRHAAKRACYACNSETRPVFDTGVVIDMEGVLCICTTCAGQWADTLGYLAPEKADALRAKNMELGSALGVANGRLGRLADARAAVLAAAEALAE